MAAAAARRGLTALIGEASIGLRPVQEVEARSASPRSVEMLLIAAALVRVLLTHAFPAPSSRSSRVQRAG